MLRLSVKSSGTNIDCRYSFHQPLWLKTAVQNPVCEDMWLAVLSHVLKRISNVHIFAAGVGARGRFQDGDGLQQENKAAFRLEVV